MRLRGTQVIGLLLLGCSGGATPTVAHQPRASVHGPTPRDQQTVQASRKDAYNTITTPTPVERAGTIAAPKPSKADEPAVESEIGHVRRCAEPCVGCSPLYDRKQLSPKQNTQATHKERGAVAQAFREYLASSKCETDEQRLELTQIGSIADASRPLAILHGAFSAPSKSQTLVLLLVGHCGTFATHAEDWGERLIVPIEDGKKVGVFPDPRASSVLHLKDLDKNGIDEVVASGGWAGGGEISSWIEVRSYARGRSTQHRYRTRIHLNAR